MEKDTTRIRGGRQACGCVGVDVHCHVVPSRFPQPPGGGALKGWPSMTPAEACHATVVIDEKPYRTISDACWVAERRLEAMDRAGIRLQALSPMPELFGYWLPAAAGHDLSRHVNDVIADLVAEGQGRFVGLGGVPLQDVDLAISELRRAVLELGFKGVEIGSNINGAVIGDPRFHPFFAEAEALGAAVFVHAVRPAGMDRLVGPAPLQQVLAYPTDVGLAAASVITGNLLKHYPGLRIAFSHGGGSFASLLPRLEQGYAVFPALRDSLDEPPSVSARRLYADSLVFDQATLRRVVEVFGPERVMIGTDFPFNFRDDDPLGRIGEAFEDHELRERLAFGNALAFLAVEEVK
ncbi:amidohydrolase family protein [Rhizobium paknamense]|uniref:2-amino-3-carboxymuconate-6-semialdehyde decarboxylase n=1 Tax=Rhizobium paknamense TaxID=1206817 RepID=A0ABU0IBT8_9HYPH|nr:amidohydrolase family protein [Rhizobium paknamense]MDQ0455680.1 aminocarboxymuconate-semialdehyde decarboxylase [Rhizobium paknamense]